MCKVATSFSGRKSATSLNSPSGSRMGSSRSSASAPGHSTHHFRNERRDCQKPFRQAARHRSQQTACHLPRQPSQPGSSGTRFLSSRPIRRSCGLTASSTSIFPMAWRARNCRCRPRGNSSSNLYLRFAASSVIFHFCHPEEAESLACERLPTKDLCICPGNGPPKCRPIALTERLFRTLPQQRHTKVPPGCQQAWPNPNEIRLERKRIENLRLHPPKPKPASSRALPEPRWRGEGES